MVVWIATPGLEDKISSWSSTSRGVKQWTKQLGTSTTDYGNDITSDSSGNVYVTGSIYGGLNGNTNAGASDLFVVKYNSSGVNQWTKQLGTSRSDEGQSITSDSSGNVYVTGYTSGGLDGNTNAGSTDLFVVKYNSSGVKQWTKQLGTSADDRGYNITSDSGGNVYVTGYTGGGLDGNSNAGMSDLIVVKYNSSGIKQWTQQLGTSAGDNAKAITSDSSGNVYVTGRTVGALDGNTNAGIVDLFVVKYNSSGVKQWTKQLGTSATDAGYGITSDSNGNIYVTGSTDAGLDGNPFYGSTDAFVVKYSTSGVKQWTKQIAPTGRTHNEGGHGITSDSSGNIYVMVATSGPSGNGSSYFVVKYDENGNMQ